MTTRQYTLRPDPPDTRDKPYRTTRTASAREVDNRNIDFPEIFDQLWLGSCTGHANAAAAQYTYRRNNYGMYFYLSPLYLYYKEREILGTTNEDSGAYIRDGLKVLKEFGCCTISYYPQKPESFTTVPDAAAEENAKAHRIDAYYRIMQPEQLRQALTEKYAVVMGIEIYSSFESEEVARTGIVPMPNKSQESFLGGHAVVALGYKWINGIEYIICRNSWGPAWGDKGYFYLPMDFIGRYVTDMWVAK